MNRVSIILGCFEDDRQFLPLAINSCLYQHTDLEIIIVDGGSSTKWNWDGEIYKNITIIEIPRKVTQAESLNMGVMLANNEWILPLDADDMLYPDAIGFLLDYADEGEILFGNTTFDGINIVKPLASEGISKELLLQTNPLFNTSLYRKDAWNGICGYAKVMYPDYWLWCNLFKAGYKFKYVDRLVFKHRIRKDSLTHKLVDRDEEYRKEATECLR